jgi:hypothetical protein
MGATDCSSEDIQAAILGNTMKTTCVRWPASRPAAAPGTGAASAFDGQSDGWDPVSFSPDDEHSRYSSVAQQNCFTFYCEEWTSPDQYGCRVLVEFQH